MHIEYLFEYANFVGTIVLLIIRICQLVFCVGIGLFSSNSYYLFNYY